MATENTMANSCPVEEAARTTCPLMANLPRIPLEWFLLASQTAQMKGEETPTEETVTATDDQAQKPVDEQAVPTPETEEKQEPAGGEELDRAAEALNWLRMGQIVGIIVIGAESDDDTAEDEPTEEQAQESAEEQETEDQTTTPTEEQTPETPKDAVCGCCAEREMPSQQQPYPEKFNNPQEGTFTFAAASSEDIQKLKYLIGKLMDSNNEPDQTRGQARDICNLALELGADRLVDICEAFTEGDATRADVAATANEVLAELAAENRKQCLTYAFELFCQLNSTTPKEMREIISG